MAATILTIASLADDGVQNMTTLTGGNSYDVGDTGASWLFINNLAAWDSGAPEDPPRKRSGGDRVPVPVLYSAGADPLPTAAEDSGYSTFTADALDNAQGDTSFSSAGGLMLTVSSSRINSGARQTFPLTEDTQIYEWRGWARANGASGAGWVATLSISDGSKIDQTYTLPVGASNVKTHAWFRCEFRGTWQQVQDGVTVELEINRGAAPSTTGTIAYRGLILRTPVPAPKPRGMRMRRR